MKTFCFTVDDNIRFLKEITQGAYASLFDHPYLALLRELHETYDLKIQLNLFYRCEEFALSQMPDRYRAEWEKNASWMKLSFHSDRENVRPYEDSCYEEVYRDCNAVQKEILRFASEDSLGKTTTVHYCRTTQDGLHALADCGVKGLLGLYDGETSYGMPPAEAEVIRRGEVLTKDGISFAPIDIVLNRFSGEEILEKLSGLIHRDRIFVMIHEQYFYSDYPRHQPDFGMKLHSTFAYLREQEYKSAFFEELLPSSP